MHAVEMLRSLVELAGRLGYQVRQEWLDGAGGGVCELKGTRIVFIDLSQAPADRARQLGAALADHPALDEMFLLPELRQFLTRAKTAPVSP